MVTTWISHLWDDKVYLNLFLFSFKTFFIINFLTSLKRIEELMTIILQNFFPSAVRSQTQKGYFSSDCCCVWNRSLLPTQSLRHVVVLSECLVGNIKPYIVTQSIPQCIMKGRVQPMVVNQAIFTIMHCAADEHMEVSIHVSTVWQ